MPTMHFEGLSQGTTMNRSHLNSLQTGRDNSISGDSLQHVLPAVTQSDNVQCNQIQSAIPEPKVSSPNVSSSLHSVPSSKDDQSKDLESEIAEKVTSLLCSLHITNAIISQFQNATNGNGASNGVCQPEASATRRINDVTKCDDALEQTAQSSSIADENSPDSDLCNENNCIR